MPRKKRTTIEETLPDEVQETNQRPDIDDLVITLSKVYKINTNGKQSFCFQTPEPVDEVTIQERYPAGGSFIVFELNSVGEQINKQSFEIEAKPMLSNHASPQTDINSLLMGELNWMRGMFMQMISNRSNEATPIAEIIRAAKDMHSMGSGKDPVDLIIKGMELGQKSNGGSGDWKTELISTAKETLAPALQLLARQPQQPNGVQPMIPQSTQPTPPATIVKQAIAWLKGKILMGLTPDLAVDWILQNGNDPEYQPILSLAVQGTIDNFIELEPDIANEPYRAWFTTAIQTIKEAYEQQSTDTSDLDGGNRNTPNDAGNAKSSTGKSKLKKVV